jgi:hypothetical protein
MTTKEGEERSLSQLWPSLELDNGWRPIETSAIYK